MLSSVEQAFVGREEIRAPLKTPAWEATFDPVQNPTPRHQITEKLEVAKKCHKRKKQNKQKQRNNN